MSPGAGWGGIKGKGKREEGVKGGWSEGRKQSGPLEIHLSAQISGTIPL